MGAGVYEFKITEVPPSATGAADTDGYSKIMITACKKLGMKPVCNSEADCATDENALFLGNRRDIATPRYLRSSNYMSFYPKGFQQAAQDCTRGANRTFGKVDGMSFGDHFEGLCVYSGSNVFDGKGANCDTGSTSSSYKRRPARYPGDSSGTHYGSYGFMCGKRGTAVPTVERLLLGSRNWKQEQCTKGHYCVRGEAIACRKCEPGYFGSTQVSKVTHKTM